MLIIDRQHSTLQWSEFECCYSYLFSYKPLEVHTFKIEIRSLWLCCIVNIVMSALGRGHQQWSTAQWSPAWVTNCPRGPGMVTWPRHQGRGDWGSEKKGEASLLWNSNKVRGSWCDSHKGDLNLKTPSPPEGPGCPECVGMEMTHDVMCDHVTWGALDND